MINDTRSNSYRQRLYGAHASDALTRRVWAAVTRTPCATTKALARELGQANSWSSVAAALRILRDAGYIAFEDGAKNARQVIVPFIVQESYRNE
jgi:hypothetical protein